MKLKSIRLTNIGLYKDEVIEFPYDGQNNTIVVWGNNGAGKTTLINSVKVGLLGKDAVQMTFPEYCQFVKTKMISTRCDFKEEKASIAIEVELNDNNKRNIYRICRSWTENCDVFNEEEVIYRDEIRLDVDEKDHIKNVISRSLPPSLLDVVVFDGENAINILNEGKISKLIKEILFSVFGMDIYSSLSKDLSAFLRSAKSNSDITASEQMDLIKMESDYKVSLKNYKKLRELIEDKEKNKINKLRDLHFTLRRFADKTGINAEDVESLYTKLSEASSNKDKLNSELKYLNEEILPLKLVHKRIKKILEDIDNNKPYKAISYLDKLKDYFQGNGEAIEWISNLESLLPSDKQDVSYDLTDSEFKVLEDVNEILNSHSAESMLNAIDNKNDNLKDIREKILISNKVESEESKKMIEKLDALYSELESVEAEILKVSEKIDMSEKFVNEKKKSYMDLKSDLTKQKKESSSYITAIKYREAIDEFIEENIKGVCLEINRILKLYLQNIGFRNNSIGNVDISPKNFEINLYEADGSLIPSFLFSAGEKQVLLGLVIKAALSLAAIDTFFLFDTPVGRLDKGNREVFTKEVIFGVSEQSFIFATDSDYSEDDYHTISQHITTEFKLRRNENDEIIAVKGSIY